MVTASRTTTAPVKTLPGRYYYDQGLYELELQRIFSRNWVNVGRADAIPTAGKYFLATVGLENVIVLRDRKGEVRAFLNVCRHRGARVCTEAAGTLKGTMQCRYHAWTYGLDGKLVGAPNMKEDPDFDAADYGLAPVAVEVWSGLIWVNLADNPRPLSEQMGMPYDRYTRYHVGDLKVAKTIVYDVRANWKLIVENFNECCHCAVAHPELSAQVPSFKAGVVSGYLGGGADFAKGIDSLTVDGTTKRPPFKDIDKDDHHRYFGMTLRPNVFLNLHPDYVLIHRMVPLAPDRTHITCDWLFDPETTERPDFDPSDAVDFWDLVNRQDWDICQITQEGVKSKLYADGGIYAPLEAHIRGFNDWVLEELGHTQF